MSKPPEHRATFPDALIDNALDPNTGLKNIVVAVSGERLTHFRRHGLRAFEDAALIPETVRNPDTVFETFEGDFLYYRAVDSVGRTLFYARVRPTGWRCFVWDFEDPDQYNVTIPRHRGADRMKRRVR